MTQVNHKAARQLAKRQAREGNRYARQRDQRRQGPNIRMQTESSCTIQMHKGGTQRVTDAGRKNGNGVFFRLRDGACVSHKLAS